jgi:saccharopine dehydrogenase-like NADP-dependent oxidoreductase
MRITVLGGAGKMGCIAVQDLANNPIVEQVRIADVRADQARTVIDYLDSPKVVLHLVNLQDPDYLLKAIQGSQVCLNATVYYTNLEVMEACLKTGAHYTDMGGLFHTTLKQLLLHDQFADSGLSAVLGMGSAPGIPNIQARYAADRLDTIESIKIYDGIKSPPPGDLRFTYAIPTILDELTMQPMVYRDGQFLACEPMSEFEDYWFTRPIGLLPMHLSLHSEVATLPVTFKDKGIKETFFKINYWGMSKETVEKVRVLADFGFNNPQPVQIGNQHIIPRQVMIHLLSEYVPPITDFLAPPKNRPPDWVKEIVTEVNGSKDGKQVTHRLGTLTCKGALPTGVAPAIAALWLGEGRIPAGVHPPEAVIDPIAFFKDLEQREIFTQATTTVALS